jgi:hypothetical protein
VADDEIKYLHLTKMSWPKGSGEAIASPKPAYSIAQRGDIERDIFIDSHCRPVK